MDTLNQAVASVKSALGYDETPAGTTTTTTTNETAGREPISGEQGAGTVTEPFDKGNETTATSNTTTTSSANPSSYNPSSATTTSSAETTTLPTHIKSNPSETTTSHTSPSDNPTTMSASSNPTAASSSTPAQPGMNTSDNITSDTSSMGTSSAATNQPMSTGAPAGQSRPDAGSRPGDVRPTEANENRPNQNAGGFGTAEPSVNADPKSAQQPKTAKEGSDRPLDEPDSTETAAIKGDKHEVEKEQKGESTTPGSSGHKPISDEEREKLAEKGELPHDPNDHSGEPMHMHGGGSDDPKKEEKEEKKSEGGVTEQQRKNSIGQEGGQPHGSSKGTGEEYVKSSGLAADGGDFDAAKPGAGKEATRLMEEKGMKKDDGSGPSSTGGSAVNDSKDTSDSKDGKPSMFQKIKDKMNPGTGSGLD